MRVVVEKERGHDRWRIGDGREEDGWGMLAVVMVGVMFGDRDSPDDVFEFILRDDKGGSIFE